MFASIFGSKKKRTDECYYDVDDEVIRFENPAKHDGPAEYEFVASQDGRVIVAGDAMYIIDAEWLQKWYALAIICYLLIFSFVYTCACFIMSSLGLISANRSRMYPLTINSTIGDCLTRVA
jgi:hypothetical protein